MNEGRAGTMRDETKTAAFKVGELIFCVNDCEPFSSEQVGAMTQAHASAAALMGLVGPLLAEVERLARLLADADDPTSGDGDGPASEAPRGEIGDRFRWLNGCAEHAAFGVDEIESNGTRILRNGRGTLRVPLGDLADPRVFQPLPRADDTAQGDLDGPAGDARAPVATWDAHGRALVPVGGLGSGVERADLHELLVDVRRLVEAHHALVEGPRDVTAWGTMDEAVARLAALGRVLKGEPT